MAKKQYIASAAGLLAGGLLAAAIHKAGASAEPALALGILVWAVIWWVTKVVSDYVTSMLMAVAMILLAKIPAGTVLSAFGGASWWLLFSTFVLSVGVTKCGLIKRMSLCILRLFPASFAGQISGLAAAGFLTAPFIPNLSAKAVIFMPLAKEISSTMGYPSGSRPDNGMFLAALTALRNAAPPFISASVLGYGIYAILPESSQLDYTMGRWFLYSLPWFVSVTALNLFCIIHRYGPKNEPPHSKQELMLQYRQLGPMSADEKKMLTILVCTLLLWATETLHHIPAYVTSICALCAMLILGIADRNDFRTKVNWDALIHIGIALGIAPCFTYLGIDLWLAESCRNIAASFSNHVYLLLLVVGALTVLLRFVIVSELALINIIFTLLVPIAVSAGINPWIIGMTMYFFISPWFFLYQNPVYMASYYAVDQTMISEKEGAKYCGIYLALCAASLIVTLTVWQIAGIVYL